MKDAALIVLPVLLVWALLSWASAPSATFAEHTLRLAAEQKVITLETRVAYLVPTANVRCPAYPRC